ncbi:Macrophage mannose receptor 1 [Toxocara canis]|uniref:Macrophage mannose receptor 1 n=1 Tax=Toxocara canis TaxID=6265 RepID=A0A0B2VXS0_TOXCA|nr:Macrophage mannose receptor 1 [Toxocara canis]
MNPRSSLATITNVFENAALRAFALNFDEKPLAWIGLNDVAENGEWIWLNGNQSVFKKWAPGYPKSEPNALCVAMNSITGLWVNKDCATRLPFFCSSDQFIYQDNFTTTTALRAKRGDDAAVKNNCRCDTRRIG